MEPLLKELRALPARFRQMPATVRIATAAILALVVFLVVYQSTAGQRDAYQYAFTNLGTEDGGEIAIQLKGAGIPYRLEAGGTALAVPADKVYDARLLLAAAGLPRGAGVGFELFDRGDIGVSEFTQRVNLRRAIEGELARTIGNLSEVRSARVHVSLAERGLYRDEDRRSSASVVLNLRPGRSVGERELAGIRHLVAAAVPGLVTDTVTVVDGRGTVLGGQESWGISLQQRELERDLEQRLVGLLEPAVGVGAVVARATVVLDASQVDTTSEVYDPESPVIRSERTVTQTQAQTTPTPGGIAGAAANQPPEAGQQLAQNNAGSSSNTEDETRNYEVSKTVTRKADRAPRLQRLSVALLIDGVDGQPRSAEEVARLGELAKSAVGFDPLRGDQLDISSVVFTRSTDEIERPPAAEWTEVPAPHWIAIAALLALALIAGAVIALRRRRGTSVLLPPIRPGITLGELEALEEGSDQAQTKTDPLGVPYAPPALLDPERMLRDRARELASRDPARAAHLLRAWITNESEA